MTTRPFQLPVDLDLMVSLITDGFQYPENPEWSIQEDELQGMVEQLNGVKRIWPMMRLLGFFVPMFRDLFRGFIHEEEGKPAGLINFMRQRKEPDWLIGNVTVLPAFRRRGIGRKLVEETIQELRNQNARVAILDVVDGNLPAHSLYKELGFEDYTGSSQYDCLKDAPPITPVPIPDGYTLTQVKGNVWKVFYEFAKRVTPGNIKKFEQVTEGHFRVPFIMRMLGPLIDSLSGMRMRRFVVNKINGEVIGWGRYRCRTRAGGLNSANVQLDPQYPELAVTVLSQTIASIQAFSPGRRIEIQLQNWQPALTKAAETLGCEKRLNLYRMGLLF